MKKIILLLIVLFSFNINAQASTKDVYYSEYSDFSEFIENEVSSSDLIDVERERRYRWYKNNITSEYMLYEEGIGKYTLFDLEDYQESEFSNWQYEQPASQFGRLIEEQKEYKVNKLKPIQTLMIADFSFDEDTINFGQVEIYLNNQKIDYQYICGDCSGISFKESGFIMIDFYEPYHLKDLTIKILNSDKDKINSFKIHAIEPMVVDVPSKIYATYTYQSNEEINFMISEADFDIINPEYEEEVIYNEMPDLGVLDNITIDTKYRYKDRYYYFYNSEKEYIEGYHANYPEYIKDDNDYKDYYRYRSREKVVIENEMTITRYKDSLEDFIISTADYDIETDINYLKNGVYSVRYVTPFQTINKTVTVDIEENELRDELDILTEEYNDLLNDYNAVQSDLNELKDKNTSDNEQKIKYEQLLEDYKELTNQSQTINADNNYVNSLKEENQKCGDTLEQIKTQNDDYEKKLKLSNQANDYLEKSLLDIKQESINPNNLNVKHFVVTGLIIILLVIILIKIMSSKN